MQFIEMSGKTLRRIISDDELHPDELAELGVTDESVVRINRQGDIEIRRRHSWDVIGELIATFREGVRRHSATADVIAWDWGWGEALSEKLIPLLPPDAL